jgi:Tol biopolymer transport system component
MSLYYSILNRYLYRIPFLGGYVQKLITDVDSLVSFSSDGRQLAYEHCVPSRNDVELKVANADGSEQRILSIIHNGSFGQFGPGLSWSPDGQTLAVSVLLVGTQPRWIIAVASLVDGRLREVFQSPNAVGRPVWMRSGDRLVVSLSDALSHRGQLWTISFPSGQARRLTTDLSDYSGELDITQDGTGIAAITQAAHSDVWLVSATDPSKGEQITSGPHLCSRRFNYRAEGFWLLPKTDSGQ